MSHLIKARVRLVHRKHIDAATFQYCAETAANRARQHSTSDCTAVSLGLLLHLSLPRMLFAKTKAGKDISWKKLIEKRVERFLSGEWEALWKEATSAEYSAY